MRRDKTVYTSSDVMGVAIVMGKDVIGKRFGECMVPPKYWYYLLIFILLFIDIYTVEGKQWFFIIVFSWR